MKHTSFSRLTQLVALSLAVCGLQVGRTEVSLPNIFGDNMVLQQGIANPVWGKARSGEQVTVSIAGQTHQATADAQGDWRVKLEPISVGDALELTVQGDNQIKFSDVLVGEVWICSGQSNMQWSVGQTNDVALEYSTAKHPGIRMINFPQVGRQEPVWSHDKSTWMVCSPESVGRFSAVGYFFGRQLHQSLHVPIGLINNAWGGSACEAWIRRDLMEGNEKFQPMINRFDEMAAQAEPLANKADLSETEQKQLGNLRNQLNGNHRPSNIYNGVLKSHLGYGIRGAIWYQGESNAGRAYQYRDLFPLMISSWRNEWGQGEFPFYWVQLADFQAESNEPQESSWAELREAQTMTMDKLANTGEAVIIDIGEGKDIHPRNKVDVGRRLARWALAKDYGIAIPCQSPRYKSMTIEGNKVVLTFSNIEQGWRPFDVNEPIGFAIAGEDKKFVWAKATVLKDMRIEVWNDAVASPSAVRYAWANNPVCNMYGVSDLPLTPFRTDDWPGTTIDAL